MTPQLFADHITTIARRTTEARPSSTMAQAELVVPRSMPTAIGDASSLIAYSSTSAGATIDGS